MKLRLTMLPVKIITSLGLIAFGAINCKPSISGNTIDEESALNSLDNQDADANSDDASFALAGQPSNQTMYDQAPCPKPQAPESQVIEY